MRYLGYRWRVVGSVGILLSLWATHVGLPIWVTTVGGVLCLIFLVALVRALLSP